MKYIIGGLIIGLIIFFGPGLIDGNFGLIGSGYLLDYLPNGLSGLIILGIIYVFIAGTVFFLLQNLFNKSPESRNKVNQTLKFSFGVTLAYISTVLLILQAFSNFGF